MTSEAAEALAEYEATEMSDSGISPAPGQWNPAIHPYRAMFTVADRTPGMYGASTEHRLFETESGARHWLATYKPMRRVLSRTLQVVSGYTGRGSNWRWQTIKL